MSDTDNRYVYGDTEGLGNDLGLAEDHPDMPSYTWEEARSRAERDVLERIQDLQKELVSVRNLTEDAYRRSVGA